MNISKPLHFASRIAYWLYLRIRGYFPRQQCISFRSSAGDQRVAISSIIVINLDREPERWAAMRSELRRVIDANGHPISNLVIRYSAYDGHASNNDPLNADEISPYYTLGDQLYVEPQPQAAPSVFDLEHPIRMSDAEVAVARSHISVWRRIAESEPEYTLVLEDDVYFESGFGRLTDQAWREMREERRNSPLFDIFYLSYKEVRHGAPKKLVSKGVFRPERGLWCLSGYVLSKRGAKALLEALPCRGPIDLWINHLFSRIDVRALRRSVINQRLDFSSTNSYSVLPTLSRLGLIDNGGTCLFQRRPIYTPVIAFGDQGAGLSSLAMALSMLGYRCCSDLDRIPECELEDLLKGRRSRIFGAYVNIASLNSHARALSERYPHAKFIVVSKTSTPEKPKTSRVMDQLTTADVLHLTGTKRNTWRDLCEHLEIAPPIAPYPTTEEIGYRTLSRPQVLRNTAASPKRLRHDSSPWAVQTRNDWSGIKIDDNKLRAPFATSCTSFEDHFDDLESDRWLTRNDTFPGNLALFRPANVTPNAGRGLEMRVADEFLGVRHFSAAAISTRSEFLYGRFEVTLKALDVPGLITGFFLHRDSPRQEIDIEITGNRPNRLLINVFYNPGDEGTNFDYGYRGTPVVVPLGFDASAAPHQYAIEWDPCEIRWVVDDSIVYRRVVWDPTPIPHLPMCLHVNSWPSRSKELAGRLKKNSLPASAVVYRVAVCGFVSDRSPTRTLFESS